LSNGTKEIRSKFISKSQIKGLPIQCFIFKTPYKVLKHLNVVRERMGQDKMVSNMAFIKYKRSYEPPTLEEGISRITNIPFRPTFESEEHMKYYYQWT